jgi:5-methylcytosine-specific restriction protein A
VDEAVTDQRSAEALKYRHLYNRKRWRTVRAHQLSIEPLCRMCAKRGAITAASHCDHIDPKTKTKATFYDGPFQSLCPTHHNSTKQAEEKRGYSGEADADGWPTDSRHPVNRLR